MDSLNKIISDLRSLANNMGYTGPTVDAIIYLMANGIYINNQNAVTAVLESSGSRCKLINSAIQHAKDNGYSVNRGTNQHIVINGLKPVTTMKKYKYDRACKIGNYTLYYAEDVEVEPKDINVAYGPIEFVLAKNIIRESRTVDTYKDLLSIKFNNINCTEDIDFYLGGIDKTNLINDQVSKYKHNKIVTFDDTKISNDLFSLEGNVKYWQATSTDYGIELYYFPKEGHNDSGYVSTFVPGDVFSIVTPEYLPVNIEFDSIKTIPGFDSHSIVPGDGCQKYIERESNVSDIYIRSNSSHDSNFVIRSKDDVLNCIKSIVPQIVSSNLYIMPVGTGSDNNGSLNVYYLLSDKNERIENESPIISKIKSALEYSYYVTQQVNIIHAIESQDTYEIELEIYYSSVVSTASVESIINSFTYKIGKAELSQYRLLSELSKLDGVEYVKLVSSTLPDGVIELDIGEYVNLECSVTYKAIDR